MIELSIGYPSHRLKENKPNQPDKPNELDKPDKPTNRMTPPLPLPFSSAGLLHIDQR
jgi:hypothetical protein